MFRLAVRAPAAMLVISSLTVVVSCTEPSPATAPAIAPAATAPRNAKAGNPPADQPAARKESTGRPNTKWMEQHEANVALARRDMIDLYFVGDALTQRWGDAGKAVWEKEFGQWRPANFGIGGDKTQHVLWRLQNGELDGVSPRAFVVMAGANNRGVNTPEQTARGVAAIVHTIREKDPQAKILLMGILPRGGPKDAARMANEAVNALLAKLDDGQHVKYMDIGRKFVTDNGTLRTDLVSGDQTYLTEKGYQVWADAIKPVLQQWLGAGRGN